MTIHPARLARIRTDHERAIRLVTSGQTPTTRETTDLVTALTDLLTEHTNRSHQ